jgi:hypothetical protein
MDVDDVLRELVIQEVSTDVLREAAMERGMSTLRESAWRRFTTVSLRLRRLSAASLVKGSGISWSLTVIWKTGCLLQEHFEK